jgi:hypothetical protein
MNVSNLSSTHTIDDDLFGKVRTVAVSNDIFQGLKGHDYIKARNLNPPVQRVQTSAHTAPPSTAEVRK